MIKAVKQMTALLFIIILLLVIIDQLLKIIMQGWLMYEGPYVVIDGLFQFSYVENRGMAFGMMQDMRWVFIALTTVVTVYLIYLLLFKKIRSKWATAGIVLIVSGGIGNMIDRLFRGYVIDYIETTFVNFAVFNFADMLVCIGAAMVIVKLFADLIVESRKGKSKDAA